jgi:putative heme transporter
VNSAAGRGVAGRRGRLLLRAVVAAAVVVAVASQRASLLSASARLGRVSPAWLALALGAETASYLAAAERQHHLLAGAGVLVSRGSLVALTYAGTAISATVPAGPAVSTRYTFRALQRRGTTPVTAAWVLAASAVLSTVALVVLGLVGAQLRGFGMLCSAVRGIVAVAVLLGAVGALAALVWSSRRPRRLEQLAAAVSARCHAALRIAARCVGHAAGCAQTERVRVPFLPEDPGDTAGHPMGPARMAVALGLATVNWVADIVALAVAFVALGLDVPWQGLLLAYALTQVATSVPLLPGSLGVAEGSMAGALVCAGVHPTAALAGVLVYRLVSFWLVLPAGWLAWTCLRRADARSRAPEGRRCGPCSTVALV